MDEIDAAVYGLVEETLCETAVLRSILSSIVEHQPPQEDGRAAAQRGVERLEKRRVRVLDMYERGDVAGIQQDWRGGRVLAVPAHHLQAGEDVNDTGVLFAFRLEPATT